MHTLTHKITDQVKRRITGTVAECANDPRLIVRKQLAQQRLKQKQLVSTPGPTDRVNNLYITADALVPLKPSDEGQTFVSHMRIWFVTLDWSFEGAAARRNRVVAVCTAQHSAGGCSCSSSRTPPALGQHYCPAAPPLHHAVPRRSNGGEGTVSPQRVGRPG
jgi:hypothetical protein